MPLNEFPGVDMKDVDRLENVFGLGIQIYTQKLTDGSKYGAYLVRRANPNFSDVMHLDLSDADVGIPHFNTRLFSGAGNVLNSGDIAAGVPDTRLSATPLRNGRTRTGITKPLAPFSKN